MKFLLILLLLAGEPINIWKGTKENVNVSLIPYTCSTPSAEKEAVIICPGGSYRWLDHYNEGKTVAKWLNENGISAFLLEYRTATNLHHHPDMIRDLQRSIQIVREEADEFGINPSRVGVMGFSAGGHLVMTSGIYYYTNFLAPLGIFPEVSLKPDFVVPVYPVVTFSQEKYVHKRSRNGLLGERRKSEQAMKDSLSLEKHIISDCPPVFLVNCKDDNVVDYHNSILLDSALTANNVKHEYFLFETGGHGFGSCDRKGNDDCRRWKDYFIEWVKNLF